MRQETRRQGIISNAQFSSLSPGLLVSLSDVSLSPCLPLARIAIQHQEQGMSARAMKWASAVSTRGETEAALDEVFEQVNAGLNGATPDVAFVFVSPQHKPRYETVNSALVHELRPKHILGCSGGGIIGGAREIEQAPALSLTA